MAYSINDRIDGGAIADFKTPASLIMMADNSDDYNSMSYRLYPTPYPAGGPTYRSIIPDRHNGGANFALADGHCKWYKIAYGSHNVPGLDWSP